MVLDHDNDRPIDSDFQVWFGYRNMLNNNYSTVKHSLELVTDEVKRQLTNGNYMQIEDEKQ